MLTNVPSALIYGIAASFETVSTELKIDQYVKPSLKAVMAWVLREKNVYMLSQLQFECQRC